MFYRKNGMLAKLLIILMVAVMLYPALPYIEGGLFPVVDDIDIRISKAGRKKGWSRIKGSFTKIRDCSFNRIEWRYGTRSSNVRVALAFPETKLRGSGKWDFKGWELQLSEDDIKNKSFAVVYHNCHPLWPTITRFYP